MGVFGPKCISLPWRKLATIDNLSIDMFFTLFKMVNVCMTEQYG